MNANVQAINDALTHNTETPLHEQLVIASQKLRKQLDKVTSTVDSRESRYARIRELQQEMDHAMSLIANGDDPDPQRPIKKVAADIQKERDAIDKDIDKVFDLVNEADRLRDEVTHLASSLADVPLAAGAVA